MSAILQILSTPGIQAPLGEGHNHFFCDSTVQQYVKLDIYDVLPPSLFGTYSSLVRNFVFAFANRLTHIVQFSKAFFGDQIDFFFVHH